jgi:phosphoribosylanthranilate isomerase
MNKGVKIKICGNTNQEDADLLVTYDIDSLGFIITNADHPNKISAEKARKIITNLPEHILSVAAVGQFSTDEIIDILHTTKAKALQIQRNCTLEDIIKIRHEFPNLIIWKAVFTHEKPDFQKILAFEDACDNILLHTKENVAST